MTRQVKILAIAFIVLAILGIINSVKISDLYGRTDCLSRVQEATISTIVGVVDVLELLKKAIQHEKTRVPELQQRQVFRTQG